MNRRIATSMLTCLVLLAGCEDTDAECESVDWFLDADGDGFGAGSATASCDEQAGMVQVVGDCDDADVDVSPESRELCFNGLDDDCSGTADDDADGGIDWYQDADRDGFGDGEPTSSCARLGAGWVTQDGDCDDSFAGAYPGALEICASGIDEDCDGEDPFCGEESPLDSPDALILGSRELGWLGRSIAVADLDGDGQDDLLIGEPGGDGAVFIVPGPVTSGVAEELASARFVGVADMRLGRSVGSAGDVNGDGETDVIMTSASPVDESASQSSAYLFHGPHTGERTVADADTRLALNEGSSWWLGGRASGAGDLDGNGTDDIVAALTRFDAGLSWSGVFVFSGPLPAVAGPSDAVASVVGEDACPDVIVEAHHDLDGDGIADLVMSSPKLVCGDADGGVGVILGPHSGALDFLDADAIYSGAAGAGTAMAIGDLNGDGGAELVLAAPGESVGGIVYITEYASGDQAMPDLVDRVVGEFDGERLGASVHVAGTDVLLGAPYSTADGRIGAVYTVRDIEGSVVPETRIAGSSSLPRVGDVVLYGSLLAEMGPALVLGAPDSASAGLGTGAVGVHFLR